MCVHACTLTCMQCQGSQNRVFVGCQSPGSCSHRQLGATMWGLGIEFKSPGRVESALSIEPSLQAPSTVFSKTIIYFSYCNCNRIGNIHFMIKRLMQKYKVWFAQSAQAVTAVLCVHGQVLARGRES